jgi:hypothetical protein
MDNYKTLTSNLKSYAEINTKIEQINKILSKLRKERSDIEEKSIAEINNLNFQNKKMKIENAHYFITQSKQSPSLSISLIETVGENSIGTKATHTLINALKEYRNENVKRTPSLKRKEIKESRSKKAKKDSKSQSLKRKIK